MKRQEDTRTPTQKWLGPIKDLLVARKLNFDFIQKANVELAELAPLICKQTAVVSELFNRLEDLPDHTSPLFLEVATEACASQKILDELESKFKSLTSERAAANELLLQYRRLILKDPRPTET